MLIVGSSQTEQGGECLSQWTKKAKDRGKEKERRSVTVLCCGKQHPGGAELKTQTVLMASFAPEEGQKDQWPVLLPSLHITVFHLSPPRGQNQNIC